MARSREEVAEDIARKLYAEAIIGFHQIGVVREIVNACLPTRKVGKGAKKAGSNES